ncbi:unnamed protein product [marine sediment metagenome]|uniref:Uncharacterized protein n=1 Tax=marine sediment metagenome TaxID=412755 RepID=X0S025_9ZZZZ
MTKEDVKKVVETLKKVEMGVLDLGKPVETTVSLHGLKEISLNILNPYTVVKAICAELDVE